MKKINALAIFLFVFQICFAQLEKQVSNKNSSTNLDPIDVAPYEYADLKKNGKLLSHQEYRFDVHSTQLVPINQETKVSTLSPCSSVLFNGTPVTFSGLDDANTAVAIPFNFCFYGTSYTSCNISTNGNVQFSTNSTAFSSTGFPSTVVNMIAPFWSDCYITNGGLVKIDAYPTRIIISWDSIGYYNSHNDKTNSFQLILTDGVDPILPAGKNIGFIYKTMQWTTGDASSGANGFPMLSSPPEIPATVGINQGNGIDYLLVGKFAKPGNMYDGPNGSNDGVSWLDGKRFYFDGCSPTSTNAEPVTYDLGSCDTLKICGNDSLRFKAKFLGPEANQTVSVTVSCPTLVGALSYTSTPNNGISDLNVLVNGSVASNGYHLVAISVSDNGTPALSNSYNLIIYVDHSGLNSSSATIVSTPSTGICIGQTFSTTASFSGTAPDSYSWSNGSTSTVSEYTLSSSSDSLFYLTINSLGCQKTLTGFVHVNPTPVASIIGATSFCGNLGSTTILTASNTVNYAGQAPYSYSWTGIGLGAPVTTQSINVSPGTYSVMLTNSFNCRDSNIVNVALNIQPQFSITPSYTSATIGGTINLDINIDNPQPNICGLSISNCSATNTIAVGSGTTANTNSSWPSVYGNFYKNSRHQMLYTASELLASGVVPGMISSISYPVNTIPVGYVGTLSNFSIKLKCVTQSVVTTTFDNTNLTEVFNNSVTPISGINTHSFSQAYLWDGTSDLLVDVCYSLTANYTSNPYMPYTNVGVNRCLYFYSDVAAACGAAVAGTTSNNRPNIIFGNCLNVINPNDYTYSWTPTTGLSNPTIKNPILTVSGSQIYTVVVTNTNTPACPATNTATVDALPTGLFTIGMLKNAMFVYPNPNNGKFEISISGYDMPNEGLNLQILNTLGQTVYVSVISSVKTTINLQDLNNGVYFVSLSNTRKEKAVTKIVIQN